MSDSGVIWSPPPDHLHLAPASVHVWRGSLHQSSEVIERLRVLLSADETARAARFVFETDRHAFVAARGMLRAVLSAYTGLKPEELTFSYDSSGKPDLTSKQNPENLAFNVSHSGEFALIAVTRNRRIGVDIERHRDGVAFSEIADRYFAPGEVSALRALSPGKQREAFFTCWARKEAYIKGLGKGFGVPLRHFEVSIIPDKPAVLLRPAMGHESEQWSLIALDVSPHYSAAVAVDGRPAQVLCLDWNP
jgi:4'-phosphopantetheinyl transferase